MRVPSLIDEIDRLFDELIRRPWGASHQLVAAQWREVEDGWIVEFPSQGLRAEDLKIEVHHGSVVVTGERRREGEERGHGVWGLSAAQVMLQRSILLPEEASAQDVHANVDGGKVTLHIHRRHK